MNHSPKKVKYEINEPFTTKVKYEINEPLAKKVKYTRQKSKIYDK